MRLDLSKEWCAKKAAEEEGHDVSAGGSAMIDKTTTGLYRKFTVTRTDGASEPGQKHDGCDYFVLDLTHDPFAPEAIRAYAAACRLVYPLLAADLDVKVAKAFPAPALSLTGLRELGAKWREESEKDRRIRHDDTSDGIWAFQHEASGRSVAAKRCADSLDAALDTLPAQPASSGLRELVEKLPRWVIGGNFNLWRDDQPDTTVYQPVPNETYVKASDLVAALRAATEENKHADAK